MFYPDELVEKQCFRKVWKAANGIATEPYKENDLTEICTEMDTLIGNDSHNARRRLSLRTSVILIDGTTRLYKAGLDDLLEDVADLTRSITLRKTNDLRNMSTSPKRTKTNPSSTFPSRSLSEQTHSDNSKNESHRDMTSNISSNGIASLRSTQENDPSATVRTPSVLNRIETHKDSRAEISVDKNMLFGCLMIYNSYGSRIPRWCLFSSLKNEVRTAIMKSKAPRCDFCGSCSNTRQYSK